MVGDEYSGADGGGATGANGGGAIGANDGGAIGEDGGGAIGADGGGAMGRTDPNCTAVAVADVLWDVPWTGVCRLMVVADICSVGGADGSTSPDTSACKTTRLPVVWPPMESWIGRDAPLKAA